MMVDARRSCVHNGREKRPRGGAGEPVANQRAARSPARSGGLERNATRARDAPWSAVPSLRWRTLVDVGAARVHARYHRFHPLQGGHRDPTRRNSAGLPTPGRPGADRPALGAARQACRVVLLSPRRDTPGCTIECKEFRDAREALSARAHVLGVRADDVASHQAFREKYALNFPLLSDVDRSTCRA